ncbi:MAG: phosphocholine cytidylyltransferase family protein [Ramlibacter sp.]|nr:phosphocholine cytidylyltransferase family protein [Ramlibacter sp.]
MNAKQKADRASSTHAVILAAGLGSRLKENTKATPKCLVPVAGRPILQRILEQLDQLGINRTTIVVGYLDDAIRNFVASWIRERGRPASIDFVLNDRYAESGSVFSLDMALRSLRDGGEYRHLLLIEGDVVIDQRLLEALLEADEGDAATLLAPYEPALSGTFATIDSGVVSAWLHESVREPGFTLEESFKTVNLTLINRGESRARLDAAVAGVIANGGVKAPLEYAMHKLVKDGLRIVAVKTNGLPWFEVDTPEDLAIAAAMFSAQPASA